MAEHDYDNGYRAGMQKMRDIAELKRLQAKLGLDEIEYIRVSDKLKLLADLKKAQNNE